MKTSVSVLTFSLFCLCVAEVHQLDLRAQSDNSTKIPNVKPARAACDQTGCREDLCQLAETVKQLETKLTDVEKQLEDLKKEVQGNKGKKVAFGVSTGIDGNYGPFNSEVTLIYKNVFYNSGAYNTWTGIFTAPVRGIYYFSFSGHNHSSKPMGLRLMKNGMQMVTVYNHPAGNRYETASNGMTLPLRYGDRVYMRLRANTWIFDNGNKHSTFNGRLLFPL